LPPVAPWAGVGGDDTTAEATVVTAGRSKDHRKRRVSSNCRTAPVAPLPLQPVGKARRLGRPLNVLIDPSESELAALPPVRQHFIVPESLNLGAKRQNQPDSRDNSCRCAHYDCEARVAVSHATLSISLYMRCKWVTFLCHKHRATLDDGRQDRCSNCCRLTVDMPPDCRVLRIACLRQQEKYVLMINLCQECTAMSHVSYQLRAIRWAHARASEIQN
jgi:hypothetical protein